MPFRFDRERVNRYRFLKQHLAAPAKTKDLARVIEETGPIRSVPASSSYLSLWARAAGFRHRNLDDAIVQARTLASVRGMRGKLYIVPIGHLPSYYRLAQSEFRNGLTAVTDEIRALVGQAASQDASTCEALEQRVLEILATRGPATIAELDVMLAAACAQPATGEFGIRLGQHLIPAMEARGLVVRAGSKGGWRSEQYRYAAVSAWLPDLDPSSLSWREAIEGALLAYIRAYGPVTLGDIVFWFGSVPRSQLAGILLRLQRKLWHLEIRGFHGDYVMLREHMEEMGDRRLPLGKVALLPPRDSYLAAYGDTQRLLDRADRDRVLDRAGEPGGTIWLDGKVIGGWWTRPHEEGIFLRFFEDIGADVVALVGERARLMARFLEYRAPQLDLGAYGDASPDEDDFTMTASIVREPQNVGSGEAL